MITLAKVKQQRAAQAADYEQWRRANVEREQAQQLELAAHEIERLRRIARTAKTEYDAHVEHLTQRIVMLSKSVEDAEARLLHVSKRERARHAAEVETAKRIGAVEQSLGSVAQTVLVDKVAKAVEKAKPRGISKRVIRDANNRITGVIEEPIE